MVSYSKVLAQAIYNNYSGLKIIRKRNVILHDKQRNETYLLI